MDQFLLRITMSVEVQALERACPGENPSLSSEVEVEIHKLDDQTTHPRSAGREPRTGAGHPPCHANMIGAIRHHVVTTPGRVAATFLNDRGEESETATYAQLDCHARKIASWIQVRQGRGQRVLLAYPPGLDFVAAYLGCLYAGAIAVPVDAGRPKRPSPRLVGIAKDCNAAFAFTRHAELADWQQGLASVNSISWLATDSEDASNGLAEASDDDWSDPDLAADDLAMLQYTSGSTGDPKGVMVSHGNLVHNMEAIRAAFEHSEASRMGSWLPHYHDMGLIGGILQPLYVGFPTVLLSPLAFMQRPILWLRAISEHRITTSGAPNFAFEHCVRRIPEERRSELDLSSWQVAYNGSEVVRSSTLDRFTDAFEPVGFQRRAFYPCYGMAEATLLISGESTAHVPTLGRHPRNERAVVSCGTAVPHHSLLIVDPDSGRPRQAGEEGEIWFEGPSVAKGYWNRPVLTERTFNVVPSISSKSKPDRRYLRTGDVGCITNRQLFITGRIRDIIVIGGVNHHAEDIEQAAERSHAWVQTGACVAFGVEDDCEEQVVFAAELTRPQWHTMRKQRQASTGSASCTPIRAEDDDPIRDVENAVRSLVAKELGVRVAQFIALPPLALPRTSSGKVRRAASREAFLGGDWREPGKRILTRAALRPTPSVNHV